VLRGLPAVGGELEITAVDRAGNVRTLRQGVSS